LDNFVQRLKRLRHRAHCGNLCILILGKLPTTAGRDMQLDRLIASELAVGRIGTTLSLIVDHQNYPSFSSEWNVKQHNRQE
jgi:hypothetical protein